MKIRVTVDSEDIVDLNRLRGISEGRAQDSLLRVIEAGNEAIAAVPKLGEVIARTLSWATIEEEIAAEMTRLSLRDRETGEVLKYEYTATIAEGDWVDAGRRLNARFVQRGDRLAFRAHTAGGPVWVVGDHMDPVAMQRGTMRFTRAEISCVPEPAEHTAYRPSGTGIESKVDGLRSPCAAPEPEQQNPVASTDSLDGQIASFIERQSIGSRSHRLAVLLRDVHASASSPPRSRRWTAARPHPLP